MLQDWIESSCMQSLVGRAGAEGSKEAGGGLGAASAAVSMALCREGVWVCSQRRWRSSSSVTWSNQYCEELGGEKLPLRAACPPPGAASSPAAGTGPVNGIETCACHSLSTKCAGNLSYYTKIVVILHTPGTCILFLMTSLSSL